MVAPFRAAALMTVPAIMMPAIIPSIVTATVAAVIPLLVSPMIAVAVVALRIGTGAGTHCSGEQARCSDDLGDLHVVSSRPEIGHDLLVRLRTLI
jgi:hypothetical protein